jgi:HEAT repeat protein
MFAKRMTSLSLAAALLAVLGAGLAHAQTPAEVDQAFAYLAKYEFGQDRAALNPLVAAIRAASSDPAAREALAARLADLLASAPLDAKRWIGRQLAVIGSAATVPAVTALLGEADTNDLGCRVLESIPAPEAGAALREAIAGLPEPLKLGAIGSLGRRGEAASVPVLTELLGNPSPAIAEAAASALGDIGDASAYQALDAARKTASATLRPTLADGCLTCAETFAKAGQQEQAAGVYEGLFAAGEAGHVRAAALNGLVAAQPAQALDRVLAAMNDADPILAAAAAGLVRDQKGLPGPETTQRFAGLLASAAPANKLLLLEALADRGDLAAGPAVLKTAADEDKAVQLAAFRALGKLGDASAVGMLLDTAAAGSGELRRTARASLTTLPGSDVNAALIKAAERGKPETRTEAITALGERRAAEAKPLLLELADGKEEALCFEALTALQIVAGEEDLPALLTLLDKAADESRRTKIEKTVMAVAQRIPDAARRSEAVVKAYGAAQTPELQVSLIRILGGIANGPAYETVKAALGGAAPVRMAAVSALATWPDATPLADLEQIARTASVEEERGQAFEGYVRMLKTVPLPPQEALKHYQNALALAKSAPEKKLVLAGLGGVPLMAALELARTLQGDSELSAEANLAALKLASMLCGAYPVEAKAVAEPFVSSSDEGLRKQAEAVMNNLGRFEDYLTAWSVTGPYFEEGKNADLLFDTAFPPEPAGAGVTDWRIMPMGVDPDRPWAADFGRVFGGFERAAYVAASVAVPKEQDAILELGSNDGVKVWLNSELVHGKNVGRPLTPGEDRVSVHLKATNTVLIAVYNKGGDWAVCARLRTPAGGAIEGLKASPFGL